MSQDMVHLDLVWQERRAFPKQPAVPRRWISRAIDRAMGISTATTTATPRTFLDFVLDGESLYERVASRFDLIGCMGWLDGEHDRRAAARLLGDAEPDIGGRISLYVCPECADPYCGVITAAIVHSRGTVVWDAPAHSTWDATAQAWKHEDIGIVEYRGGLRFGADQYRHAVEVCPPSGSSEG